MKASVSKTWSDMNFTKNAFSNNNKRYHLAVPKNVLLNGLNNKITTRNAQTVTRIIDCIIIHCIINMYHSKLLY